MKYKYTIYQAEPFNRVMIKSREPLADEQIEELVGGPAKKIKSPIDHQENWYILETFNQCFRNPLYPEVSGNIVIEEL